MNKRTFVINIPKIATILDMKMKAFLPGVLIFYMVVFAGCSAREPLPSVEPERESIGVVLESSTHTMIDVFYGTNRNDTNDEDVYEKYGTELSEMTYGVAKVSVPKSHSVGEIERPSFWKLEFKDDPDKHIMIHTLKPLSARDFVSLWNLDLEFATSKDILIFVHGYSNPFAEALLRTAQLSYDLEFPGIAMTYSWPSQGKFLFGYNYAKDEEYVAKSIPHFTKFIEDVIANADGARIHIVAHSMGNRLLTRAIAKLDARAGGNLLNQIILAAPDINVEVFKDEILPKMRGKVQQITVYRSADDKALLASKTMSSTRRLGEQLFLDQDINTIDASGINISFLAHSYFSKVPAVIDDLQGIVLRQETPSSRNLNSAYLDGIRYWKFSVVDEVQTRKNLESSISMDNDECGG